MRDNEHEITCPANPARLASVDEAIDDDPRAPDLRASSSNGHADINTPLDGDVIDAEFDPEADDEETVEDDEADLAGEKVIRATVDGREARIDSRPLPPAFEPEFADLMESFTKAKYALEERIDETKAAKERQKTAQAKVDLLGNKLTRVWSERHQLAFPFAAEAPATFAHDVVACPACGGEREGTIPLANGAKWCVPCVQTAMAEPRADSPIDARPPELSLVLEALSAALRAEESPTTDRAADAVDALAGDTRDLGQIRADLAEIAEAYAFVLSVDPPYVTKAVREEFAPA